MVGTPGCQPANGLSVSLTLSAAFAGARCSLHVERSLRRRAMQPLKAQMAGSRTTRHHAWRKGAASHCFCAWCFSDEC
eukprot:236780-Alexandrium_andersonii.AAC.2